jgi:hypothetical protein
VTGAEYQKACKTQLHGTLGEGGRNHGRADLMLLGGSSLRHPVTESGDASLRLVFRAE